VSLSPEARPRVVAFVMTLLFGATPAIPAEKPQPGGLYRCSALDAADARDDGTIIRPEKNWDRDYMWSNFLIDTISGLIRWTDGTHQKWVVVQRGSAATDFVATPYANTVSASMDLIRVSGVGREPTRSHVHHFQPVDDGHRKVRAS
jgi:hypothetical protein